MLASTFSGTERVIAASMRSTMRRFTGSAMSIAAAVGPLLGAGLLDLCPDFLDGATDSFSCGLGLLRARSRLAERLAHGILDLPCQGIAVNRSTAWWGGSRLRLLSGDCHCRPRSAPGRAAGAGNRSASSFVVKRCDSDIRSTSTAIASTACSIR